MEGKKKEKKRQLFRQYDEFNGDTFLEFLKKIHTKFQKCYLFMDKASPYYTCKKVIKYFEDKRYVNLCISSHRITGVYGYGKGMEHSQTGFARTEILSILCRFKE
jgi:hypothetical protein